MGIRFGALFGRTSRAIVSRRRPSLLYGLDDATIQSALIDLLVRLLKAPA